MEPTVPDITTPFVGRIFNTSPVVSALVRLNVAASTTIRFAATDDPLFDTSSMSPNIIVKSSGH